MSSEKGNAKRSRPQKYANHSAFKKDLYGTTSQTKELDNLKVEGLCSRCTSVIHWKIKFLKYKKLSVPSKCTKCLQKTVKEAYHTICRSCATVAGKCPKCCEDYGKHSTEEKPGAAVRSSQEDSQQEIDKDDDGISPSESSHQPDYAPGKNSSRKSTPDLPSDDSSISDSD